ncbi:nuclear transport factor 2 family protein [Spongiimicrobium salis]|uniref:nuclear transport factor 2 family protein n=1 Tax=Spongiimicrobium salis TaxID=1667022 RepID=UPI00374CFE36
MSYTTNTAAQLSERELIEKTLTYYMEGGKHNDFEILKKAFHPTATMKFVADTYTEVKALEFFKERMVKGTLIKRVNRIHDISISGNAANARIELEYPTFTYIDYMNLLKIDGEWKIVSKIFSKRFKEN